MPKSLVVFLGFCFSICFTSTSWSQLDFYETTFNGGVTVGGWSPEVFGTGTGNFSIYIEPGSSILVAYLVAGRLGPGDGNVTLNSFTYPLDLSNQITGPFSTLYGDPCGVHVVDVTNDIDPAITNYEISGGTPYQDFQLIVFYENPLLSSIVGAIFLNVVNLNTASSQWALNFDNAIVNADEVALSFFNSYQCDMASDSESITVNGTLLGNTGTQDSNSGWCTGTLGNFYYQNASIQALGDDDANQSVNAGDALSDVAALVPNGSTSIDVLFQHAGGNSDNHQWSIVAAFGSSCQAAIPTIVANNVCLGEETTFVEESGNPFANWSWNFGDQSSSSDQNTFHTYSSPGEYTVILSVTDQDGCINNISSTVIVYDQPQIQIALSGGCEGEPYILTASGAENYSWNPGNLSGNEIEVTLEEATIFDIYGTNEFGCESTIQFEAVPVPAMEVELSVLSNSTCEDPDSGSIEAILSGGLGPFNFEWSPSGTVTSLNSQLAAGTYFVTITDSRGCILVSEPVEIIQTGLPLVLISGPDVICSGETITLSASGADTYEWSTGEDGTSIEVSPSENTTYSVVGNNGSCENSDSISIEISEPSGWSINEEYLIELGQSIQLDGNLAGTYTWSPSDGLSCINCANPIASPTTTTLYTVIFEDALTGCISEHQVLINVEIVLLFIPNVVTLTQDGLNESFRIEGGPFRNPRLLIYNRWGNLLFETTDPLKGWNLKIDGEPAAGGTYYYIFSYESLSGNKSKEGFFTLLKD